MSTVSKLELADRVAGALWGMLIADALAMPVHWFYVHWIYVCLGCEGATSSLRDPASRNLAA
eukprot:scaffold144008_cov69-Phaeocystis_antarctica.AAC.2